ncbi:MAG: hypothetical protein OWQ48_02640 [Desulfurococcus sp.]|nr:hypothetical protein [Desulfurococcus sp.]
MVEDKPGIYIVELNGLAGEFRVLKPPTFVASNLKIELEKVNVGEGVSVAVNVTNVGDLSGTYIVVLRVNGTIVETKDIALDGRSSTLATFTIEIVEERGDGVPRSTVDTPFIYAAVCDVLFKGRVSPRINEPIATSLASSLLEQGNNTLEDHSKVT